MEPPASDRGLAGRRSEGPGHPPRSRWSRRRTLAATAGAITGLSAASGAQRVRGTSEYEVVLDIVDDLGADNTGGVPINDQLARAIDRHDSVELRFPEGEYEVHAGEGGNGFARWDLGPGDEGEPVGTVALVGEGWPTLRPASGNGTAGRHNVLTLRGRDLRIENFVIDQTADDVSTGIASVAERSLLVRNLHFTGTPTGAYFETPAPGEGYAAVEPSVPEDPTCLVPGVLDDDGTGEIAKILAPDGAADFSRKGGVAVHPKHAGDLLFTECEFSHFSDHALDASPPGRRDGEQGSVRVENSLFRNNNVAALRLGSPGSYAKRCAVLSQPERIPAQPWGAITSRAGWLCHTFDGTYEGVDVVHNHPAGQGIVGRSRNLRHVRATVEDCRIELNNDDAYAIQLVGPGVERVDVSNVAITGDAGSGAAIAVDSCPLAMEHVCLAQTGPDRDGMAVTNATGHIRDVAIDVTGESTVIDGGSNVEVEPPASEADCRSVTG